MPRQPSLFVLKSAPGAFLSSAAKWALSLTRNIELLSMNACTRFRPGGCLLPGRTFKR
jgi:hypothetical protein